MDVGNATGGVGVTAGGQNLESKTLKKKCAWFKRQARPPRPPISMLKEGPRVIVAGGTKIWRARTPA